MHLTDKIFKHISCTTSLFVCLFYSLLYACIFLALGTAPRQSDICINAQPIGTHWFPLSCIDSLLICFCYMLRDECKCCWRRTWELHRNWSNIVLVWNNPVHPVACICSRLLRWHCIQVDECKWTKCWRVARRKSIGIVEHLSCKVLGLEFYRNLLFACFYCSWRDVYSQFESRLGLRQNCRRNNWSWSIASNLILGTSKR